MKSAPSILVIPALLAVALPAAFAEGVPDLENHPGKAIYQKLCLDCHGPDGKGVKDKADDPLEGSRTLESLADRIDRTMPEDEAHLSPTSPTRTKKPSRASPSRR